jgi:hypothetical protein
MWTLLTLTYLLGLTATAVTLSRERAVGAGRVVEAAWSVLWPLYWGVIFLCSYRNRRRPTIDH